MKWKAALLACALAGAADAQVAVIGSLSRDAKLEPGETLNGTIQLKNRDDKPAEVKAYQTDYLFHADGKADYAPPGTVPRSNARWVTVTPTRMVIPAGQMGTIKFEVTVPQDRTLAGTYWSMVMVEPLGPPATPAKPGAPDTMSAGISTVVRYAVQIATDVGRGAQPKIKFLDKQLVSENGAPALEIALENQGERLFKPKLWVDLFDEKGKALGKFEGTAARLYPSCSARCRVPLKGVKAGRYKALVVLHGGDRGVFGARYDIAIQ